MIYEVRTYDIKPRSLAEVEKRFGEAYEHRKKYSEMSAFWHTEIGPLNQIIHVWSYKDVAEREKIRAAAVAGGNWPPKIQEFVLRQDVQIMHPFSFMPEIKPGKMGPYFEIRTYTFKPGHLPIIKKNWESAINVRLEFGPMVAVWYADVGAANTFQHIWPYQTLDQRAQTRDKAAATGMWPSSRKAAKEGQPIEELLAQENKIVVASSFSPLQ